MIFHTAKIQGILFKQNEDDKENNEISSMRGLVVLLVTFGHAYLV